MGLNQKFKMILLVLVVFLVLLNFASFKIFKHFDEFTDMTRKVANNSDFLKTTKKMDINDSYLKFIDDDIIKLRKTVTEIFPDIEKVTKLPINKMNKYELDDILIKAKKITEIQNRYPVSESEKILSSLGEDGIYRAMIYGNDFTDGVLALGKNYGAQFAEVTQKTGKGSVNFYKKYIKGKEKIWITTGLLAAFFLVPEQFANVTGDITEYGLKRLSDAGIYLADELSKSITASATYTAKNYAEKITSNPLTFIIFWGIILIVLFAFKPTRLFIIFISKKICGLIIKLVKNKRNNEIVRKITDKDKNDDENKGSFSV
jgi:hypothetical protein